jgi:hypothetical protein
MSMLLLTGCHSWGAVTVSPRQLIEEQQPDRIRVLHADGRRLDLRDPRIESDWLTAVRRSQEFVGSSSRGRRSAMVEDTVRIALTNVRTVDVRRFSLPKTVGAVIAGATGVVVVLYLICAADDCFAGS